jgi:hypothetical protein
MHQCISGQSTGACSTQGAISNGKQQQSAVGQSATASNTYSNTYSKHVLLMGHHQQRARPPRKQARARPQASTSEHVHEQSASTSKARPRAQRVHEHSASTSTARPRAQRVHVHSASTSTGQPTLEMRKMEPSGARSFASARFVPRGSCGAKPSCENLLSSSRFLGPSGPESTDHA